MLATLNCPTEICFTDGMVIETNWEVNTMMAVLCIGNLSVLILDFLDGCAVLALDSHGPQILQNRIFSFLPFILIIS